MNIDSTSNPRRRVPKVMFGNPNITKKRIADGPVYMPTRICPKCGFPTIGEGDCQVCKAKDTNTPKPSDGK